MIIATKIDWIKRINPIDSGCFIRINVSDNIIVIIVINIIQRVVYIKF